MKDENKARLAKQGLAALELTKTSEVGQRLKGSIKDTAGNVALRGIATVGRLAGGRKAESNAATAREPTHLDFDRATASWNADDAAAFDQQLRAASANPATILDMSAPALDDPAVNGPSVGALQHQELAESPVEQLPLSELHRTFPPASQKLALLIFNCVTLLQEISDEPTMSDAEREKKEKLLTRIAALIQPQAGPALESFVAHVVELSRKSRDAR